MLKVGQGMTLQQSPRHPVFINRFFQENQILNLTEVHHPFDPLLLECILEDSKVSGVLGGWFFCIHEEIQLDLLSLVRSRSIHLLHFLNLAKRKNRRDSRTEDKSSEYLKTYPWSFLRLIWLNRIVIILFYVERTIAIYECYLF
jgi:hypothetical protein